MTQSQWESVMKGDNPSGKGGVFYDNAEALRSAARFGCSPGTRRTSTGMRLLRAG